ncbi:MAG: hypothetical protein JHC98_09785 [Thermoleophilaceae bacterium]|nr:hypothetical protein [Thermoleophilaceae bacterium]
MNLVKGLMIAVAVFALALGISLGHDSRPTDADAQMAKREAFAAASKRARIAARGNAFNSGLQAGMLKGARQGKAKGEAAALEAEPTGATGSSSATTATGGASPTGATGR